MWRRDCWSSTGGTLCGQRLVDVGPALRTFRMKPLDGGIDLAARRGGEAVEFLRRHNDGDIAAAARDTYRVRLRSVEQLAEAIAG